MDGSLMENLNLHIALYLIELLILWMLIKDISDSILHVQIFPVRPSCSQSQH
jgi:hypothetical protein